ncbi:MAG: hypothetical protein GY861_28020 [bacterium]|nr:hypothetical protein [bacterium]
MKRKIHNFIKKHSEATIVDLEENIEGFTGDHILYIQHYKPHYWTGISEEAINALSDLLEQDKIDVVESYKTLHFGVLYEPDVPLLRNLIRLRDGKTLTFKARSYN